MLIAERSDKGMATAEIKAVLKLKRNKYKIAITNTAPIIISTLRPLIDASIKLAGLNSSVWILISSLSETGRSD
jgi:hypothetical protein